MTAAACSSVSTADRARYDRLYYQDAVFEDFLNQRELPADLVCPVHQAPLKDFDAYISDGMCVELSKKYVRAKLLLFPYSYWIVPSCSCVSVGELYLPVKACPECRQAELVWRKKHGWPTREWGTWIE